MDHIIDEPESQDLKPVRKLFPHAPEEVFEHLPAKPIDVLVGLNYFGLHPNGGEGRNCVQNLQSLHSIFYKGWTGHHPDIEIQTILFPF